MKEVDDFINNLRKRIERENRKNEKIAITLAMLSIFFCVLHLVIKAI